MSFREAATEILAELMAEPADARAAMALKLLLERMDDPYSPPVVKQYAAYILLEEVGKKKQAQRLWPASCRKPHDEMIWYARRAFEFFYNIEYQNCLLFERMLDNFVSLHRRTSPAFEHGACAVKMLQSYFSGPLSKVKSLEFVLYRCQEEKYIVPTARMYLHDLNADPKELSLAFFEISFDYVMGHAKCEYACISGPAWRELFVEDFPLLAERFARDREYRKDYDAILRDFLYVLVEQKNIGLQLEPNAQTYIEAPYRKKNQS